MTRNLTEEEKKILKNATKARVQQIMEAQLDELFEMTSIQGGVPEKAQILETMICEGCGEPTMESRTRRFLGRTLCIPCFEAKEKRTR